MDCTICQETISNESIFANLECGHNFHIECVRNLRNPSCPVCREPIKSSIIQDNDVTTMIVRHCLDQERELEDMEEDMEEESTTTTTTTTTTTIEGDGDGVGISLNAGASVCDGLKSGYNVGYTAGIIVGGVVGISGGFIIGSAIGFVAVLLLKR